jgi:small-conductance mechanosensitive channel
MNEQVATISHAKDTMLELAVRFGPRVLDQGPASGEVCAEVLTAFRARGVVMPPPQREVHIRRE